MSVREAERVRLVICDFGGVICSFDYGIFCDRLARRIGAAADAVRVAVFGGNLQREFEQGRLTGQAYHRRVMGLVGADVPYAEFCWMYGDIFSEIPATSDLIRRMHSRHPLYLLSDTNEIHFGWVRERVEVLRLFDEFVLSCEVGIMKPEPGIYLEALRRSGLPAHACVFIDDRSENVAGARNVGMRAIRFESPTQCAAELAKLGVAMS